MPLLQGRGRRAIEATGHTPQLGLHFISLLQQHNLFLDGTTEEIKFCNRIT